MCVLIFSTTLSETFLILRRNERDMFESIYIGLHVKYLLFSSDFKETVIFSTDFRNIPKYQSSWKSVQWQTSCSIRAGGRTDGQTDVTKLIVAFRRFAKAPKKDEEKKKRWIFPCQRLEDMLAESKYPITGLDMRLPGGKVVSRKHRPPLLPGTHFY